MTGSQSDSSAKLQLLSIAIMKVTRRFFSNFASFTTAALLLSAASVTTPVTAQTDDPDASAARKALADNPDLPPSRQSGVTVMVEFVAPPAAAAYAEALRTAQAQVDAQRNYALIHPNLRTSKTLLSKPAVATTIGAAAVRQVASKVRDLDVQLAALRSLKIRSPKFVRAANRRPRPVSRGPRLQRHCDGSQPRQNRADRVDAWRQGRASDASQVSHQRLFRY